MWEQPSTANNTIALFVRHFIFSQQVVALLRVTGMGK